MRPVRDCAMCGRTFTVPANNPHRRYCAPRCRVADWRHRLRADSHTRPDDRPVDVGGVTNAVTAANAANGAGGGAPCPHCGRPVTVINMLLAPTAAHVRLPKNAHG